MKKVLWISRHEMTTAQLSDLERIMGGTVKLLCPQCDRTDAPDRTG